MYVCVRRLSAVSHSLADVGGPLILRFENYIQRGQTRHFVVYIVAYTNDIENVLQVEKGIF